VKRIVAGFTFSLGLWMGAFGTSLGQTLTLDPGEDGPGHQPAVIPGTTITWPKDDAACDHAYGAGEYEKAIGLCTKAVGEYKVVIQGLVDTPGLKDGIVQNMTFNQGYTELEIAEAYDNAKNRDTKSALQHAAAGAALAHSLLDPIRGKFVRDETEVDSHVMTMSAELLDKIHEMFPSIPDSDGKAST
jgi:hypothetical protein